jgi:Protein of unknown function (DUF3040)
MALSMDEQRMLAEIERRLAAEDPGLASCLTTFRRPGPATVLRSPRARIIGSLFTVLLVAMVSLMVYAMIPFRAHSPRPSVPTAGVPGNTAISSATRAGSEPSGTPRASASATTSASSGTQVSPSSQSSARSPGVPTGQAQATGKSGTASVTPGAIP